MASRKSVFFLKSLKIGLPWLVAVVIFYYLFSKYPLGQLAAAMRYANLPYLLILSVVYFLFMWAVDCWSLSRVFTLFGTPTRFADVMTVRLATYLVMVFNYPAAQGILAYFFKRTKNIPFFKSTGLIFFITLTDLYWTISLALVGSFFAKQSIDGIPLGGIIRSTWIITTGGLAVLILACRSPFLWAKIPWQRARDLMHVFNQASPSHYAYSLAMRFPLHLAIVSSFYFVAMTFGSHIPFSKIISCLPIVLLIGTLPLTPGGLGTVQLATVEFFKNDLKGGPVDQGVVSSAELLISMSLGFIFLNYLLKALAGSFFFKKAVNS